MQMILSGLRAARVDRVVSAPGIPKVGVDPLEALQNPDNAELVELVHGHTCTSRGNVQYACLFHRCALVLCHCEADTPHVAFQADMPVLGTLVLAGQPFYIDSLSAMNIEARLRKLGLGSITDQALHDGVRRLLMSSVTSEFPRGRHHIMLL